MDSIVVENLTKSFGGKSAVGGVSFAIPEGSFATLLGPSGCGKSTTLRLLAGLERPSSGSISIRGEMVSGPRLHVPPASRKIGFVFQAYALWPHLRVREQVAYPLQVRGVPKEEIAERVKRALETVGLSFALERYPAELSGGQQQRVALARALVFDPDILLLDEPLSNLDAELRAQMRNELYQLHQRIAVTTVYVTHDQLEALSLSDVVVVMNEGHVVEAGQPAQIYDHPTSSFTAGFVGGASLIPGKIAEASDGMARFLIGDSLSVVARCDDGMAVGDMGRLAIKPEDIVIGTPDSVLAGLPALVTSTMYFGSYILVDLDVAGVPVHAHAHKSLRVNPGDHVTFGFADQGAHIFRR